MHIFKRNTYFHFSELRVRMICPCFPIGSVVLFLLMKEAIYILGKLDTLDINSKFCFLYLVYHLNFSLAYFDYCTHNLLMDEV